MKAPLVLILAPVLLLWPVAAKAQEPDMKWLNRNVDCFFGHCYREPARRVIVIYRKQKQARIYRDRYRERDVNYDRYDRDRYDRYGRHERGSEGEHGCKSRVVIAGNQHLTVAGAKKAADDVWAGMVRFRYGEMFMDLDNARRVSYTCSRSSIAEGGVANLGQTLTRCEIEAAPCAAKRDNK